MLIVFMMIIISRTKGMLIYYCQNFRRLMMKTRKLITMVLLSILLLIVACGDADETSEGSTEEPSGGEEVSNFNETGMPIVNEPITIEVFSGKAASTADDWNDVPLLNKYEEMTNITMNFEQVAIDGLAERRNLALATGDLPDLFYGAYIPNPDIFDHAQQGTFIPLNDLIEEHAPNISQYLEEYPEVKQGITFPDGNIYSVPTLHHPEAMTSLMEDKPWINQEILDEVGMDNPETTEEFYEYLKASKELTVDGEDVIPFSSVSMDRLYHLIHGAFGIQNRGLMHGLVDEDPVTNDLRFFPIVDDYREMLEYMHKLFNEGLIEQNIFSIEVDQFLANGQQGRYAAMNFFNPIDYFGEEIGGRYIPGNALEGPNGHKSYTALVSPVRALGHFLITSVNEYPAETIRWIDYFWSDEGSRMFFLGIEGETYEMVDGEPELMDVISNNPDGLTVQEALAQYIINPGGGHPVLNNPEYSTAPEFRPSDVENAEQNAEYLIDPWPIFLYTEEEQDRLSVVSVDLAQYVSENKALFVSGERDFSEWDDYVNTIENMGLDEYMDIIQEAHDRHMEN